MPCNRSFKCLALSRSCPKGFSITIRVFSGLSAKCAFEILDAMMGKKPGGFKLPGTKVGDDKPKELSKNAKKMMELLAMQKAKKERKTERKIHRCFEGEND